MRTKSTLEKAVKFVSNCKFIFSFRKNIFKKDIFFTLSFLTISQIFAATENVDPHLSNLENSGQEPKLIYFKDLLTDLHFSFYFSSQGEITYYGKLPTSFAGLKKKNSFSILSKL